MKTHLYSLIAIVSLATACQEKQEKLQNKELDQPAVVLVTITNHKGRELKYVEFLGKSEWEQPLIVLDNSFIDTLELDKPVIKTLEYNMVRKDIFLEPHKSLEVRFDAIKPEKTWKFGGDLASENRILDSVASVMDQFDFRYAINLDLNAAAQYTDSLGMVSENVLSQLTEKESTSTDFLKYVRAYIDYNVAGLKMQLGERKDVIPEGYYGFIDNLSLNSPELLDVIHYRVFLYLYLDREADLRLQKLDSMAQNEPEAAFKQSLAVVEEFENDEIRNYSRFNAMNTRLMWEGLEGFNQHLVYFKKHNTDNHYRKQLDLAYAKKYTLAPGQAAPDFELPNANNETKSLKDFRGQYVLIDFWNTRCSICMREMPYFKKIQSEFENENIAFVSISNDPDPERWKAFVKDQKDFGTDLRTENFWDSEVFRAYQVNGTPTYVLVDPAGIIINPMAPKPSTPELKKLLASVLNTQ